MTQKVLYDLSLTFPQGWGWSGGAKELGKLSVPGRLTSLDYSRARAYCACSRCGWGVVWTFFSLIYLFSFLSPSLWETARYRLKYCLKGPLNPKQPTNQPIPQGFWLWSVIMIISQIYAIYSRTSMARTSLEPWSYVRDRVVWASEC